MKNLILIKLGGSLITDKSRPYTARPAVIRNLAKQIKILWDDGYRFVIAHGGGSFPHISAAKYKTVEGIKKEEDIYGLAVVQQDALAINRIVNQIFLKEKLPVLSFAPSSFSLAKNGRRWKIFGEPVIWALKIKALPLVFGDVVLDCKKGCAIFSGEVTLNNLISPLKKAGYRIKEIIFCGITDGVYDLKGKTIKKINQETFRCWSKNLHRPETVDVTGGMDHKVRESLAAAKLGVPSLIINGFRKNELYRAVKGWPTKGTFVV